MRPPRTLFIALGSLTAFAFTPAMAHKPAEAETVEIQLDFTATAPELYRSIRAQALSACKPKRGSNSVAARLNAKRKCQKRLVADIIAQIQKPELSRLAEADGIRPAQAKH